MSKKLGFIAQFCDTNGTIYVRLSPASATVGESMLRRLPQFASSSSGSILPFASVAIGAKRAALTLGVALAVSGCNGVSVFSSPEGNIAFGAPRANAGGNSAGGRLRDQPEYRPPAHIARSAFDRWRPQDLGLLPANTLRRRAAEIQRVQAGPLAMELRSSDLRAPGWGGDTYLRLDMRASGAQAHPARDLAVLLDTRDENSLRRAKRMTAEIFETLREGDRGALITTDESGRVRVPLLSYGAVPLLMQRTQAVTAHGNDDLAQAVEHATVLLAHPADRIVRLAIFSGNGGLIDGEAVRAIATAQEAGIDVVLIPLTQAAAHRMEPVGARTSTLALERIPANEPAERQLVDELSSLPPSEPVARDVMLSYEALPAPSHLLDVYGGVSQWTPSGGDVPLGNVRPGDIRTLVFRMGVAPYPSLANQFEPVLRVRWRDATGPHEQLVRMTLPYVETQGEWESNRATDVLHYVSLLGTIAAIHRAVEARDANALSAMAAAAIDQSRTMSEFARDRGDRVMAEQARLLRELVALSRAGW